MACIEVTIKSISLLRRKTAHFIASVHVPSEKPIFFATQIWFWGFAFV